MRSRGFRALSSFQQETLHPGIIDLRENCRLTPQQMVTETEALLNVIIIRSKKAMANSSVQIIMNPAWI
jgi:hypothetical protein